MHPPHEANPLDGTLTGNAMRGSVAWNGHGYDGQTEGGKRFSIYDQDSPSPMEMVLHAHATCSLIDVIGGLKDRRGNLREARVEIDSSRASESPRVFEKIHFVYVVRGDVPEALVDRIIHRSHEKLCSVGIMLTRGGVDLTWELDFKA